MKQLWVFAAVLALAGCASKPSMEDIQKDVAKADQVRAKAEEDRRKKRQVQAEEFLDVVPKWALEAPKPDGGGLYAVGSAESDSLNVSLKKSTLDAEFGLAKLYRQELLGSERSYTQERNDRALNRQYTALIDKLVTRVPVVGYEVIKQEVKAYDGAYHSWVLLRLPYAQFNKVLHDQRSDSMDGTVKEAFDDLERRVKARQEERQQQARSDQDLRLKELQVRSDLIQRNSTAPSSSQGPSTVQQPLSPQSSADGVDLAPLKEPVAKSTVAQVIAGSAAEEKSAPAER